MIAKSGAEDIKARAPGSGGSSLWHRPDTAHCAGGGPGDRRGKKRRRRAGTPAREPGAERAAGNRAPGRPPCQKQTSGPGEPRRGRGKPRSPTTHRTETSSTAHRPGPTATAHTAPRTLSTLTDHTAPRGPRPHNRRNRIKRSVLLFEYNRGNLTCQGPGWKIYLLIFSRRGIKGRGRGRGRAKEKPALRGPVLARVEINIWRARPYTLSTAPRWDVWAGRRGYQGGRPRWYLACAGRR